MASSIIGQLRVNLGLDMASFSAGIAAAQGRLDGFAKRMGALGKKMQVTGAVMSAAISAPITLAVRNAINDADDMSKAAQKFGVPIETLTKLNHAADMSGVSLQTLGTSLSKLSRQMAGAAAGDKGAVKLFAEIGVSATDAAGNLRPTEDVLADISAVIAAMPDGAAKTALSVKLLGKSGAEMVPMLNGGRDALRQMMDEAAALGLVIDTKTGKAAEAFNDNLSRLWGIVRGLSVQIAAELAPVLEQITNKIVEVSKAFQSLDPETRRWLAVAAVVAAALGPLVIGLGFVASGIGVITTALGALATVALAHPVLAMIAAVVGGAVLIYQNWDGIAAFFTGLWDAVAQGARDAWAAIDAAMASAADTLHRWDAQINQAFRDGWEAIITYLKTLPARFVEIGGEIIEGLKAGIVAKWDAMVGWFHDKADALVSDVKGWFDIQSPSRVFRQIGQFITAGLGLGIADNAPMAEDALAGVAGRINGQADSLTTGMQTFGDMAKSVFVDVVTGAQSAGDAIKGMVAQWASSKASDLAGLAFDGLFGGWFANGAAFSSGRVMAFANGGVVSGATAFGMRGGLGVMGEAGPEAIMPLTRGPGGKLGVQSHGGGQALNLSITMDESTGALGAIARNVAGQVVAQAAPAQVRASVRAVAAASRKSKSFLG